MYQYKINKYIHKNKEIDYQKKHNNDKKEYQCLKSRYTLKQIGGINNVEEFEQNFIQNPKPKKHLLFDFHGGLAENEFKIPKNINFITSDKCGTLNYFHSIYNIDMFDYQNIKQSLINNNTIKKNNDDYLLIQPNNIFYNLDLSFDLDNIVDILSKGIYDVTNISPNDSLLTHFLINLDHDEFIKKYENILIKLLFSDIIKDTIEDEKNIMLYNLIQQLNIEPLLKRIINNLYYTVFKISNDINELTINTDKINQELNENFDIKDKLLNSTYSDNDIINFPTNVNYLFNRCKKHKNLKLLLIKYIIKIVLFNNNQILDTTRINEINTKKLSDVINFNEYIHISKEYLVNVQKNNNNISIRLNKLLNIVSSIYNDYELLIFNPACNVSEKNICEIKHLVNLAIDDYTKKIIKYIDYLIKETINSILFEDGIYELPENRKVIIKDKETYKFPKDEIEELMSKNKQIDRINFIKPLTIEENIVLKEKNKIEELTEKQFFDNLENKNTFNDFIKKNINNKLEIIQIYNNENKSSILRKYIKDNQNKYNKTDLYKKLMTEDLSCFIKDGINLQKNQIPILLISGIVDYYPHLNESLQRLIQKDSSDFSKYYTKYIHPIVDKIIFNKHIPDLLKEYNQSTPEKKKQIKFPFVFDIKEYSLVKCINLFKLLSLRNELIR